MCMCFVARKKIILDKITAILTLTFQTLVSSIDWMCWGSWVRMGQGVRTGLGHGGITCVLQTQFSSFFFLTFFSQNAYTYFWQLKNKKIFKKLWSLCPLKAQLFFFNPIALRKAKIVYNFGVSECSWVHVKEKNPLKCMPCFPFSKFQMNSLTKMGEKSLG